jgi:hypothetical protein
MIILIFIYLDYIVTIRKNHLYYCTVSNFLLLLESNNRSNYNSKENKSIEHKNKIQQFLIIY